MVAAHGEMASRCAHIETMVERKQDNRWHTDSLIPSRTPASLSTKTSLTGQPGADPLDVRLSIQVRTCSPSVLVDSIIQAQSHFNHNQRTLAINSRCGKNEWQR